MINTNYNLKQISSFKIFGTNFVAKSNCESSFLCSEVYNFFNLLPGTPVIYQGHEQRHSAVHIAGDF